LISNLTEYIQTELLTTH